MKILIADPYPVVRAGLKHHLQQLGGVSFIEAGSVADAITALSANPDLDLVLSDLIFSSDDTDQFECLRRIRRTNPNVPVIVFSVLESRDVVLRSIDLGAMGYIPKSFAEADIVAIVRRVLDGETWIPTKLLQQSEPDSSSTRPDLGKSDAVATLTDRQTEVFGLLAQGRSNRQIALSLGVSEHTVRVHMSAILKTLGVQNRTQAAILASQVK